MRKLELAGKTTYITEKDHTQLLKRFDLRHKIRDGATSFIPAPCPFCPQFFRCVNCPFDSWSNHFWSGCLVFLLTFLNTNRIPFGLHIETVSWVHQNRLAEPSIARIYNALLRLPKISRKEV